MPLEEDSATATRYLARHDHAMRFARANRALIAHRFARADRSAACGVSDVDHNMVTREDFGAGRPRGSTARARRRLAEALSSFRAHAARRATSCVPTGDGETAAWSLAHGAGRRWQRGYAKSRLSHKYRVEDLARTELGGRVICEDRELIYDEAPQAYKDIAQGHRRSRGSRAWSRASQLWPVLTYKVRRRGDD